MPRSTVPAGASHGGPERLVRRCRSPTDVPVAVRPKSYPLRKRPVRLSDTAAPPVLEKYVLRQSLIQASSRLAPRGPRTLLSTQSPDEPFGRRPCDAAQLDVTESDRSFPSHHVVVFVVAVPEGHGSLSTAIARLRLPLGGARRREGHLGMRQNEHAPSGRRRGWAGKDGPAERERADRDDGHETQPTAPNLCTPNAGLFPRAWRSLSRQFERAKRNKNHGGINLQEVLTMTNPASPSFLSRVL